MEFEIGPGVRCNVARLVDTRLLVQANSGGGKSWCLRRLLEQTHGAVQQFVIDPEGEFASLRERFDYVLAAKGGDTSADPRSAKLLAERLLELGVSAILDIYELKAHDRVRFVRYFCEALVDAPKKLWHPALVVVDEAHVYCPQKGEAESAGAVIDLATRGRKRGFCLLLATQRLSKLHKDAAAEMNNKLIGRTSLDVDMDRAADELGFTGKDQKRALRDLGAGEFYAFGPALSRTVTQTQVGAVATTHPKTGARLSAVVPPPTEKVRALLPKLADLPAEVEARQKTVADLQAEVRSLSAQLRARPKEEVEKTVTKRVEVAVIKEAEVKRLEAAAVKLEVALRRHREETMAADSVRDKAIQIALEQRNELVRAINGAKWGSAIQGAVTAVAAIAPSRPAPVAPRRTVPSEGLSGPEQRILDAIAELEQLGVPRPERIQVALLADYTNLNSKGFSNGLGSLHSAGLVEYPEQGKLKLTELGRDRAAPPARPRSALELQERLIGLIGGASGRVLVPLIEAYPAPVDRQVLAEAAGYGNLNSKGFTNAIGRLRSLGFIDYPNRGQIAAQPVLFLEGAA